MTPGADPAPASAGHAPRALPRSGPANSAITAASAAGDISAAPAPCSARPASRAAASPDSPHGSDDAVNRAGPPRVIRRAPVRPAIRPPGSISPPKNTVQIVITHGNSPRCRRRAAPIPGSATVTTVTSSTSISCAQAETSGI